MYEFEGMEPRIDADDPAFVRRTVEGLREPFATVAERHARSGRGRTRTLPDGVERALTDAKGVALRVSRAVHDEAAPGRSPAVADLSAVVEEPVDEATASEPLSPRALAHATVAAEVTGHTAAAADSLDVDDETLSTVRDLVERHDRIEIEDESGLVEHLRSWFQPGRSTAVDGDLTQSQ